MSQDPAPAAANLGTLSTIPLELRERIYGHVLDLNAPLTSKPFFQPRHARGCSCGHVNGKPPPPKSPTAPLLSLLLVSKAIHSEARTILFQTNEWLIEIDTDDSGAGDAIDPNKSIMNMPGWKMYFSHSSHGRRTFFNEMQIEALDRDDMWAELRYVHLSVGAGRGNPGAGILEYDILPWKRQTKQGAERPSFVPLLKKMNDVVKVLDHCSQLHLLRISLRSIEKIPGSIEMVLAPLRALRGIKKSDVVVVGMQDDLWVDWNLKGSYGRYLNLILGMPRGTEAPEYTGDDKVEREGDKIDRTEEKPEQTDKSLFDMVGARWKGGREFAYPADGDSDEEQFDDFEAEMEEFDEFMEMMGLTPPMGMFGPEDPWATDQYEDDEDEDEDEDDYFDEYDEDEDDMDSEEDESEEEETDDEMPELINFGNGLSYGFSDGSDPENDSEDDSEDDSDDEMPELVPVNSSLPSHQVGADLESDDEMPELVPVTTNLSSTQTAAGLHPLPEPVNRPLFQHFLMRNISHEDEGETIPNPIITAHHLMNNEPQGYDEMPSEDIDWASRARIHALGSS